MATATVQGPLLHRLEGLMDKETLEAAIDAALAPARERMQQASEPMRALLPCETDWATSEELAELHRLQMELIPLRQADRSAARQRAAARREARRKARAR